MKANRIFNFSPGPAALPDAVRRIIAEDLSVPGDFAPSVMEISHRGGRFSDIAERLRSGLRRLTGLGDSHEILLLQGGAHLQFAMLPMNLARDRAAAYLVSGHWAEKAVAEAERVTRTVIAGTGRQSAYTALPELGHLPAATAYLHYTGNETVNGIQYPAPPAAGVPLAADLSSEFLSRPYPYAELGAAYAGAQKNLGIAGLCVVLLRKDLLERIPEDLPAYLDYRTWASTGSMFNTPCTFAWYVALHVVEWIENEGGLETMGRRNGAKADALYQAIDASDFYTCPVEPECRSMMNAIFRLPERGLEEEFAATAEAAGLSGLKGHRAVGGLRASLYNALTQEAVETLVEFMREFERRRG